MPSLPAVLATGLAALLHTALPAQQAIGWKPVASTESRGGRFDAVSFSADGKRMLTGGQEGDLILWDVGSRRELWRHAGIGGSICLLRLHPRDPWAIVVTAEGKEVRTDVVLLGSGRRLPFPNRRVRDLAFDASGVRVVFLCGAEDGHGQEILVYREEAVLAGRCDVTEFRQATARHETVLFAPDGESVFANGGGSHERFALRGYAGETGQGEVMGFAADGQSVLAGDRIQHPQQVCGGATVSTQGDWLCRRGRQDARWHLPEDGNCYCTPVLADDGTVAIADRVSAMLLCTDDPMRQDEITGHRGPPLQIAFSTDGGVLAVAGRASVRFLDCATGAVSEVPLRCGVQPGPGRQFTLVHDHAVWSCDAGGAMRAVCGWSQPGSARPLWLDWTGNVAAVPFVWMPAQPKRPGPERLWLGAIADTDEAVIVHGANRRPPVRLDRSVHRADAYQRMRVSGMAAVDGGFVLTAEDTPPIQ